MAPATMTRCCLPLLVLAAALTASASPLPAAPPAPASDRGGLLLDRSVRRPLDLADPHRPRAHHQQRRRGPASAPAATADPLQLPTALRPFYYNITLTPDLESFSFDGFIEIYLNAIEDADQIVLHSKELSFGPSDCTVLHYDMENYTPLEPWGEVTEADFNIETEIVTLPLSKPLQRGLHFVLRINKFVGILNTDLDGFYRSSYKTSAGETRWLATTQFEPTGARRAFPCWDEPSYKARYDITIKHDASLKVLANMPADEESSSPSETVFMSTLPVSSYLIAFIVSDFDCIANDDKTFETWSRKEILPGGKFAQDIGQKALAALSDFNGVNYSLPKMDQAAIPDFAAGAMENWGLVTYKEAYLIETAATTTRVFESIALDICHEFGHQWTGDLVTLDWWSHTWLNEGFASFYEYMICQTLKPEWNLEDKMLPAFYHIAMESDVRETQVAMSSPASGYDSIEDHFGVISYEKGGSVLRMFYHVVTPDVFKKAMRRYLSDYMFKNTNPTHLFKAFDAEVQLSGLHQIPNGVSFGELASTWTEQPGVPVLSAVRDYKEGSVTFTQKRFLYGPAKNESLVNQQWYIPLVVTSQAKPDFDTALPQGWLDPLVPWAELSTDASADQWVLVNPKQTGYFRVNYDADNWKLLQAALAADPAVFPAATRAQLVNDALALARAGQLDYALALPFLRTFTADRSVAAWQAAITALEYLKARLATTPASAGFLELVKSMTGPAYDEVGYVPGNDDDHEAAYLRYYVASYACYAGNAKCLSSAASALSAWLADPAANALHPDTSSTTLCYGVRGSDDATFAAMEKKWQSEKDSSARYTYVSALACSGDKDALSGLLIDAITKYSKTQDGIDIFNAILGPYENHNLVWSFFKANADDIQAAYRGSGLDVFILESLIQDTRTREDLKEIHDWAKTKYESETATWAKLEPYFASAEVELSGWFDKYYGTVSGWLADQPTTPAPASTSTASSAATGSPPTGSPTTPAPSASTTPSAACLSAASSAVLALALALVFAAPR
ncbi:hypothetical protein ONE63_007476 [Megalurothrips usitatus]|uniref:Aminopeptidase n=1 Tax=Megalurothrips usitatus TaxID=439358 RepID=A0AAV7XNY4_9NEOP|nr:hypothetical protein ONE63_007476 [Megalurothrips usitatus]